MYVPECSHKGSDVWGAHAATEPVALQKWVNQLTTCPQCSVGQCGPTGLSLSGEEEDGGRASWQTAEQFIHVGLTEVEPTQFNLIHVGLTSPYRRNMHLGDMRD